MKTIKKAILNYENKKISNPYKQRIKEVEKLSDLLIAPKKDILNKIDLYKNIIKKTIIDSYLKIFKESKDDKFDDFLNSLLIKVSNFRNNEETIFKDPIIDINLINYNKVNNEIIRVIENRNPNLVFSKITPIISSLQEMIKKDSNNLDLISDYYTKYKNCYFEWFGEGQWKIFHRDDKDIIYKIKKEKNKINFNFNKYRNQFDKIFMKFKLLHAFYSILILIVNVILWPLAVLFVGAIFALLSGQL